MKYMAQAIAFASLCFSAAALEIKGFSADGLWVVIVLWVIFVTWHESKKDNK